MSSKKCILWLMRQGNVCWTTIITSLNIAWIEFFAHLNQFLINFSLLQFSSKFNLSKRMFTILYRNPRRVDFSLFFQLLSWFAFELSQQFWVLLFRVVVCFTCFNPENPQNRTKFGFISELNIYKAVVNQDSNLKRDSFRKSDIQFTETSFKSWF